MAGAIAQAVIWWTASIGGNCLSKRHMPRQGIWMFALVAALLVLLGCTGSALAAPANDAFVAADYPWFGTPTLGNNAGATKESGEPNHGGNPGGHSVWYRRASAGGRIAINTCGSGFDTLLGLYSGFAVDGLTKLDD